MTMIPQGRCLAVTAGAWVVAGVVAGGAAWAVLESPAAAQPPEVSEGDLAANPAVTDGLKQKVRQDAPAADAVASEADAAASKIAPPAAAPKSDAAKGATPPAAMKKADPAKKPGDAPKGTSPEQRRAVTTGSVDRSLAEEKAAIDGVTTKTSIDEILARTLPLRSDRAGDWLAGAEPLHHCGEPRWIEPCIPLPPCHPSHPPHPYDLVGVAGDPTCGPIYRGPCCPRTGTHDDGPLPRLHRVNDRLFDAFYRTK